jgi:iron complex outermembrane recepter protein
VLFFEPSGRHLALFNLFAQDEIALSGDRLHLVLGSKFENYTYNGWDAQPSARLIWIPSPRQSFWGAISRAVRIPTQFEKDLRITLPGAALVLVRGDTGFQREGLTAYEIGYRVLPLPQLSFDIATYYNDYDNLRSQEAPAAGGFPLVLGNGLKGRTYGAEVTAPYQLLACWRLTSGYSNLQKNLSAEPGSTDTTAGRQEGIDPCNQFSLRSNMDLPRKTELDFWVRHVSALQLPSGRLSRRTRYSMFAWAGGRRRKWRFRASAAICPTGIILNSDLPVS